MTRFHPDLPRGFCKAKLRRARLRWHLSTEIHHIVPREFSTHPRLKLERYDVEQGYNLLFMPTRDARSASARPVHTGGHAQYNAYVRDRLDACGGTADFLLLLLALHLGCRGRRRSLPWK